MGGHVLGRRQQQIKCRIPLAPPAPKAALIFKTGLMRLPACEARLPPRASRRRRLMRCVLFGVSEERTCWVEIRDLLRRTTLV